MTPDEGAARAARHGSREWPSTKIPLLVGFGWLLAVGGGCGADTSPTGQGPGELVDTLKPLALNAMDGVTYHGFEGGLYPDGANELPVAHRQAGLAAAAAIEPLGVDGLPDPNGRYALLSIGMSNTTQEFCSGNSTMPCDPWTFVGQALADDAVNDEHLVFVNGASAGETALEWTWEGSPSYQRVLVEDLQPAGLSELQVQAVWMKVANPVPDVSLPNPAADAYVLEQRQGDVLRALLRRYPNLRMVFVSSRIYAGYATVPLNPEPYAFESGFGVKWLIEAQIRQEADGTVDAISGDLEVGTAAPWVGWGPYLWAEGTIPNPDGITWVPEDFAPDGTHPSVEGAQKVGSALLAFFKGSPLTTGWFLR